MRILILASKQSQWIQPSFDACVYISKFCGSVGVNLKVLMLLSYVVGVVPGHFLFSLLAVR